MDRARQSGLEDYIGQEARGPVGGGHVRHERRRDDGLGLWVERALILSDGETLGADDFLLTRPSGTALGNELGLEDFNLDRVEKAVVRRVLVKHDGNISRAARELGITRTSLYRRMSKYGL